jgi:probable rRNA maturation factor
MPEAKEKSNLEISKTTKGKLPRLPFWRLKEKILGKKYKLSLVFADPATSKRINRSYRGKNKPADVLSFPYSPKEGEILICPMVARKKAKDFGLSAENFLIFLLIHGMLHLKGHRHGSKMERKEAYFLKKYKL